MRTLGSIGPVAIPHLVPHIGTRLERDVWTTIGYMRGCAYSFLPKLDEYARLARAVYQREILDAMKEILQGVILKAPKKIMLQIGRKPHYPTNRNLRP